MKFDAWLLMAVFVVWAVLAALYAIVPMLHMPGYPLVWGTGAVIFLALALFARARGAGRNADRKGTDG